MMKEAKEIIDALTHCPSSATFSCHRKAATLIEQQAREIEELATELGNAKIKLGEVLLMTCPDTRHRKNEIMTKYPIEDGRIVNPFNPTERPTFLPGDKVRDKRDASKTTWRIVARIAHGDSEIMTLRKVGDDTNEVHVQSSSIVPHLEMVAMSR